MRVHRITAISGESDGNENNDELNNIKTHSQSESKVAITDDTINIPVALH